MSIGIRRLWQHDRIYRTG